MSYGYKDSSEVSKQSGKFGLNKDVFITKFEYNPNGGANASEQDAIDLTVQISDREYRSRFYPVNKAYGKDGGEITNTSSPEYKKAIEEQVNVLNATLSDIVKCFVGEEVLKQALATPIASFKDYAMILQRLVHSAVNWDKKPLDVFLQYQYSPKGENDKAYLELPSNVKHGSFITESIAGDFVEERTSTHIRYKTHDNVYHVFKRGEWYVKSPFANQTVFGTTSNEGSTLTDSATPAVNW